MTDYVIGLDLGQAQDPAAMAVLHRVWWRKGQRPNVDVAQLWHEIPTLISWPLGTPYPRIVQDVIETYGLFSNTYARWGVKLVVDAGGPGRPVIDLLKGKRMFPIGVTITGGESEHIHPDGTLSVPKRDICAALVVAAQSGDVKVPPQEWADEFEKQISTFGYVVTPKKQQMGYESMDNQVHDDLVLAAALALWYSTMKLPKAFPGQQRGAEIGDTDYNPIG